MILSHPMSELSSKSTTEMLVMQGSIRKMQPDASRWQGIRSALPWVLVAGGILIAAMAT